MSFWDNVKKLAQPYSDDEFDDYDEDDYMDDYEEPAAEPQPTRRRRAAAPAPAPAAVDDDDAFAGFTPAPAPAPAAPAAAPAASSVTSGGFSGRVVSSASTAGKQEVILFRPVNFNDASKVADDLRSRKVVVVNLENVDKAMARRVVDFLSGCVYSIDGSVKKIAQSAYLFCPSHLVVTGDLESLQAEVDSYI